eukprot:gene13253-9096_t
MNRTIISLSPFDDWRSNSAALGLYTFLCYSFLSLKCPIKNEKKKKNQPTPIRVPCAAGACVRRLWFMTAAALPF